MKLSAKFKEYVWLVNTIYRHERITLPEINRLWVRTDMSGGEPMARATFCRHRNEIEDIFGLYIACDMKDGARYYISNSEVLGRDTVQHWMLSVITMSNILSESLSLQDRIVPEATTVNDEMLVTVLTAMKRSVRVSVVYRRYGSDKESHLDFEPYCIKLFERRWYVLGHFCRPAADGKPAADYFGIFAFDRILSIRLTDVSFIIDPKFSPADYFRECYGIYIDNHTMAERIVLRAYGKERYYLRDLPIHSSQREVATGDDYSDFELFLRPTEDFCSYLLGHSVHLRVLSPDSLVAHLRDMLSSAYIRYTDLHT